MPSRPTCLAILLVWVFSAGALVRRDVLPSYWMSPPPDLRTVALAETDTRPSHWDLSVAEVLGDRGFRSVGRAMTESRRTADGGTELISRVDFDSGGLLRGTPYARTVEELGPGPHLEISNVCEINPSGLLRRFRAQVRSAGDPDPLLTLDGRVQGDRFVISARGPTGPYPTQSLPYEPRGLIQNAVGPVDRLPGLQVGQRWETRIVSPLTRQVETVKTEVTGKHAITWDNNLVTVLEVVQHWGPISSKTWVRRDGLVLRQEVPLPFVRLILERLPDHGEPDQPKVIAP